ncbi:mucin-2-like isoform X2 [Pantherophis guttatus]|uniref:Mucin-2-like isoform X2 n=1 Tax=Pantherophis guttatus TaxID=94885 RepID=A0A6P9APY2_PANGU|nr:mucin-2-like isoform X2 [Pantherophis guttatus]
MHESFHKVLEMKGLQTALLGILLTLSFSCAEDTKSPTNGPTHQVPIRPKTTFPAPKTPHPEPEGTTESFKGGPTPQVPVRPKTTLPKLKTPHPEPEETTESFNGGPTPQVPVRPKPTFPQPKTPHREPEETTENFKGGPTPQVPVRPKPTFPAPKTRQPQVEETTENFKGGENGGDETAAPTPDSKVDKCPQGSTEEYDDLLGCKEEEEEEEEGGITFPPPTPDSDQILTKGPQKVEETPSTPEPMPVTPQTLIPTAQQQETSPVSKQVCYTRWFNEDNPDHAGDFELVADIMYRYPSEICSLPEKIEVQTLDGIPASATGQKFAVKQAIIGFICLNVMQGKGRGCRDYRVRFVCPQDFCSGGQETVTPSIPVSTLGQLQSSPEIPTKGAEDQTSPGPHPTEGQVQSTGQESSSVCRTIWFNQDNPFGEGDQELLVHLRKLNPQKICSVPLEIEVQTTDGIPASETGQRFAVNDPLVGFSCINAEQGKGQRCYDYQVRFTCPPSFCTGSQERSTPEPAPLTSLAPTSTLEQEQSTPQFPIQACKTQWINRDNSTGTGDYELVYYIQRELPKALCKNRLAIEVETVRGVPAYRTGQLFAWNDPINGFACIHADQGKSGLCHDYKVRFVCPHSFCSGGDQKDEKKGSP